MKTFNILRITLLLMFICSSAYSHSDEKKDSNTWLKHKYHKAGTAVTPTTANAKPKK